jgi:23S rRNA pseudouridine1911/1915/1917 synthase
VAQVGRAPLPPAVVYRDAHLLVLDKPVGIATTSPDNGGPSLFALARALDPEAPALHPLSRLDTQVSGLVTFARTAAANQLALEARRQGTLRRAYLGLTAHPPKALTGTWKYAIAIDARDPRHRRALAEGSASELGAAGVKQAQSEYRVFAVAGPLAALDLWPVTGRTHQLRVHAAAAGAPLAGDVAYGGERRVTLPNGRILSAGRVMLHCAAFRMPHPGDPGHTLTLSLAPPADMLALWRAAGGDASALSLSLAHPASDPATGA